MAKTLGEKAKINRLNKAYDNHFGQYHEIAEFWANPNDDPCVWVFNIPSSDGARATYLMSIDDTGLITLSYKPYCDKYDDAMRGNFTYLASFTK